MNIFDKLKHTKLYKNICPSCYRKGTIGITTEDNIFICSCGKKYYVTNKNLGATTDTYKELN